MKLSFAQIAAQAIVDAGAGVVTHVPGFGCTWIFDAVREIGGVRHPVSFHEETPCSCAKLTRCKIQIQHWMTASICLEGSF